MEGQIIGILRRKKAGRQLRLLNSYDRTRHGRMWPNFAEASGLADPPNMSM